MKIFDAHFHIIDPEFPLEPNHGYQPPPFCVGDYLDTINFAELAGGAIVSGSFQAFEQEYLLTALQKLGDDYAGVANIPWEMPDPEIQRLDAAGVKAVRFNLKRGGSESIEHLKYLSDKLNAEYGWRTELYTDSRDLPELMPLLKQITSFSIDHLGLSGDGLLHLYRCVEIGARVKATGFGRIDFDPVTVMKAIMEINPGALMFGTDLPSTRTRVPFSRSDIDLIVNNFSETQQQKIFYQNASQWYGSSGKS